MNYVLYSFLVMNTKLLLFLPYYVLPAVRGAPEQDEMRAYYKIACEAARAKGLSGVAVAVHDLLAMQGWNRRLESTFQCYPGLAHEGGGGGGGGGGGVGGGGGGRGEERFHQRSCAESVEAAGDLQKSPANGPCKRALLTAAGDVSPPPLLQLAGSLLPDCLQTPGARCGLRCCEGCC